MSTLSALTECDWKPIFPIIVLLQVYWLFMPWEMTPFWELAPHQQAISLVAVPTIWVSIFWFYRRNQDVFKSPTPEEAILDE